METNEDGTEVLETTVEPVVETVETPEPTLTPEEIAGLKEKAAKTEELESKNKQLFERLEKEKAKSSKIDKNELSQKDLLFLAKSDIHAEDIDEVTELAKLKKIDVGDAYKYLKPVLDVRAEERRTAAATAVKGGARGSSKVSGSDLLAQASRGEEVEGTDENMSAIFQARLARKTGKYQKK